RCSARPTPTSCHRAPGAWNCTQSSDRWIPPPPRASPPACNGCATPMRAIRLHALGQLLQAHRVEIAAAIHADFGNRPTEETELLEIFPSLSAVRHALRHGRRWMRPKRCRADLLFLPARTELRPQPLGVVGIIVPWNYPLYLAVAPLVDALAAGNRV